MRLTWIFAPGVAHNLNWYRFIGRILGKALYEGILVDVAFAPFFLAKVRFAHIEHLAAYRKMLTALSVLYGLRVARV